VEGGSGIAWLPSRAFVGAGAALLALAASTAGAVGRTAERASGCGLRGRAVIGSLGDRDARRVAMTPRTTNIAALAGRRRPERLPNRRDGFERQTWEIVAQITEYRLARNGGVRLILFDDHSYMRAELPPLACLTRRTPARSAIVGTRTQFLGSCGRALSAWRDSGAVAYVSGVGYWGSRAVRQAAPNGAQLHPITSLRLIAGCR
jgi:hypothetical protein